MGRGRWLFPLGAVGVAAAAGRQARRRARTEDLRGQVAVITGSSRGLGLALARELTSQGCAVVLSARDTAELERARQDIQTSGGTTLVVQCDVTDRQQVQRLISDTEQRFGRLDILINNAGMISVGPLEQQSVEDFEQAMAIMFWGVVYPTLEALPSLRARRGGHIVNITSIGGKVSVPHMLPYSAAKFAAVGFSEGLHAETAGDGVHVLTVVPGLMRTGSHVNALFKGQRRKEFGWFSLAASLPVTSMAADDAARQIVSAVRTGESEIILSWQAGLAARVHGLAPGLTSDLLGLVDRLLPAPQPAAQRPEPGHDNRSPITDSPLTTLGERAADDLNQR